MKRATYFLGLVVMFVGCGEETKFVPRPMKCDDIQCDVEKPYCVMDHTTGEKTCLADCPENAGRTGMCNHKCMDFYSNSQHCGACGNKCNRSQVCLKGECREESQVTTVECCGSGCVVCADVDPIATKRSCVQTALDYACQMLECPESYHLYEGKCVEDTACCGSGCVDCYAQSAHLLRSDCVVKDGDFVCDPVDCEEGYHLDATGRCVENTVEACGPRGMDCAVLPYWKSGKCVGMNCVADACTEEAELIEGVCTLKVEG